MKLTQKQEELLTLLREGWTVRPSSYMGRFGTISARASRQNDNGTYCQPPKITQHTIDALAKRGLVKISGSMHDRVIVLCDHKELSNDPSHKARADARCSD